MGDWNDKLTDNERFFILREFHNRATLYHAHAIRYTSQHIVIRIGK